MKGASAIVCLLLLAWCPTTAFGQANAGPVAPADLCARYPGSLSPAELALYAETCRKPEPENAGRPVILPAPAVCNVAGIGDRTLAAELQKACVEDLKNAFAFNQRMRDHNANLYKWQAGASDDMRVLVWVVVLAGLAMAVYQLAIVMQIELWRARRRKAAGDGAPVQQSIELGLGKVQITSSVTGVIVLAISIAFLYLYLTEVYPIKPPPT